MENSRRGTSVSEWTRDDKDQLRSISALLWENTCHAFITTQRNGQRFPLLIPILFLPILLHFGSSQSSCHFLSAGASVYLSLYFSRSLFNASSISPRSGFHFNFGQQPSKWDSTVSANGRIRQTWVIYVSLHGDRLHVLHADIQSYSG